MHPLGAIPFSSLIGIPEGIECARPRPFACDHHVSRLVSRVRERAYSAMTSFAIHLRSQNEDGGEKARGTGWCAGARGGLPRFWLVVRGAGAFRAPRVEIYM